MAHSLSWRAMWPRSLDVDAHVRVVVDVVPDHRLDERLDLLRRALPAALDRLRDVDDVLQRVADDLLEQFFLAAHVVVEGGAVCAERVRDVEQRGRLEPALAEQLRRYADDLFTACKIAGTPLLQRRFATGIDPALRHASHPSVARSLQPSSRVEQTGTAQVDRQATDYTRPGLRLRTDG
jgi:hypothetical protein